MSVELLGPRYGRGHKPDKAAQMPDGAHLLAAHVAADDLPDYATSSDLFRAFVDVGDQEQTSGCWGYTNREALTVYCAGQLGMTDLLSAGSAYYSARAMLRKLTLEAAGIALTRESMLANPLTDEGSEPTAGVLGLQQTGIATEVAWPSLHDPAHLNAEEDLGEAEDAIVRVPVTVGAFGAIAAAPGKDRITAVRRALAPLPDGTRGRMVPGSISTRSAGFENADGSRVLSAADFGPVGGWDHSCGLLAYRPSATRQGEFEFLLPNHWSKRWAPLCLDFVLVPGSKAPLAQLVSMPGCVWIDESAVNAMADLFLMNAVRMTQRSVVLSAMRKAVRQ